MLSVRRTRRAPSRSLLSIVILAWATFHGISQEMLCCIVKLWWTPKISSRSENCCKMYLSLSTRSESIRADMFATMLCH